MSKKIKVILPVGEIPLTATVTKINGTSKFTLAKTLRIFSQQKDKTQSFYAEEGTIFLVDNTADFTCVPTSKEFVWLAEEDELREWLERYDSE